MALLAQTTYTVKRAAKDGYSVSLSPESIVLTKNSSGVVSDLSTAKTKVSLTVGGNGVTPAIGTLVVSGCAATRSGMDITITSVLASSGYVDIPVTYKNFSVTKRFVFTTVMVDPVTIKKEVQSQLAVESELIVAEVTATTKVYVNGKMDELTIGGRNYAKGTRLWDQTAFMNGAIGGLVVQDSVGFDGKEIIIPSNNTYANTSLIPVTTGDVLTISIDVKFVDTATLGNILLIQYFNEASSRVFYQWIPVTSYQFIADEYRRITYVHTCEMAANLSLGLRATNSSSSVIFRKLKIEKGNKATDWTPAPEDVDANISNVQTQVTSAVSRLTIAETNIKTLVSQTTTIGNTVSSHSTSISQLNNQIALKADSTTVTGINTRLTSAEAKIAPNAINLTVKSQITTAVNNVQIGGRNLLLNTPSQANKLVLTATRDDYSVQLPKINANLEAGKTYIFSLQTDGEWGGTSGTDTIQAFLLKDGAYTYYLGISTNNSIFTPTQSGNFTLRLDVNKNGVTHSFWNIKLEEGNKATDWMPAPEDVDAAIALRPTTSEIKAGISITSGGISIFGQTLSLAGKVTFSSLDSSTQSTINSKATTGYVDSAKSSAISTAASDATTKANTALTNAKSYSDTLKNSLGGLAYLSAVSLAKLDSTIVEGGYIKTSLIDADAIITGQLIADRVFSTDITTGRLTVTTGAKVAGFKVSGNSLTNEGFNNDAYIIMRNDTQGTFVGIGGNVANGISEFATTARIENNRKDSPIGNVIALRLSASGCQSYYSNVALDIVSGCISGFRLKLRTVTTPQTLSVSDSIIITERDSGDITLTLPSNAEKGQMYFIRKNGGGRVWINGNYIINDGDWYRERSTSVQLNRGGLGILMYNGTYWTWNNTNG